MILLDTDHVTLLKYPASVTNGKRTMTVTYHQYRGFVFTIAYQAQDPVYTVNFPDFPTIITSAATLAGV